MSEGTTPPAILGNANLSDSEVADVLVEGFPLQIRMLVGAQVRELIQFAIGRERARASGVVESVAALQAMKANGVGQEGIFAAYGARVLMAASKMVQDPPGACARCGGRRRVPGSLAGPDGQPLFSDCPACSSTPEAPGAEVSEISAAKPSEG